MSNILAIAQKSAFILAALLFASLTTASHAADEQRYYDIEIVIFQNNAALKTLPELIRDPQPLKLPEHYIQLGMPDTSEPTNYIPDYYFKLLPSSDYKLTDAATKIAASKDYRILKHIAWVQPGLDQSVAIPIFFQDTFVPDVPTETAAAEPPGPLPLYTHATLDGVITVSLSRYLHIRSKLRFQADGVAPLPEPDTGLPATEPDTELPTAETDIVTKPGRPTTVVYVMNQSRRMRSKVLHYLDNPMIGMLVIMTQVELPKQPVKAPPVIQHLKPPPKL